MFPSPNFTEKETEAQQVVSLHWKGLILFNSKGEVTTCVLSNSHSYSTASVMGHVWCEYLLPIVLSLNFLLKTTIYAKIEASQINFVLI